MESSGQSCLCLLYTRIFLLFAFLCFLFANAEAACPLPGYGIDAFGTEISESGCTITTDGSMQYGVGAFAGGIVNLTDSSILTTGNFTPAVEAEDSGTLVNLNKTTVHTKGDNSAALSSTCCAAIVFKNGRIITEGNNSSGGLASEEGSISLSNTQIDTYGTHSHGIEVSDVGQAEITNSQITTHNVNSSVIYSEGFSGQTNHIKISQSTLNSLQSSTILINGGNANIDLTNVNNYSGINQFLHVMGSATDPAHVKLVASNSILTGAITIEKGSTAEIYFLNNTSYTGAIDPADITIDASSSWTVTGNSVVNNLVNTGRIIFGNGPYKTLTVNNAYTGLGGTIILNSFLGDSSSGSDVLIIGGTATGTTHLIINDTGGDGAITYGNGILIMRTTNNGVIAPGAFHLAAPVIGKIYEYNLYQGGSIPSEANNWYLRSIIEVPEYEVPPSAVVSGPSTRPGYVWIPNIRREISLYTALPSVALIYNRELLTDTLHERIGEEEQLKSNPELAQFSNMNGLWIRTFGQDGRRVNGNIFRNGPDFDYTITGLQTGLDLYHKEHISGGNDFIGIYGVLGKAQANVEHILNVTAGTTDLNAYTAAGYWTHFGALGWYLDGVINATYQTINARSSRASLGLNTHGTDVGVSLEGGYPLFIKNNFLVEPEVQMTYQNLDLSRTQDAKVQMHFNPSQSVAGRLGARIANTWSVSTFNETPRFVTLWFSTNLWHEFSGKSITQYETQFGNVGMNSTLRGTWIDLGIGASAQLLRNISLFMTANTQELLAGGRGHSYGAKIGLRFNF